MINGNLGLGLLILLLIVAVCFIAPIVIALRAKPLGHFPYRWAIYVACLCVLMLVFAVVNFAASFIDAGGRITPRIRTGTVIYLVIGMIAAFASIALFQRKRFGVVFLICAQVLLLITASGSLASRASNGMTALNILCDGLLIVVNVIYFRRRWALMRGTIPILDGRRPA